MSDSVIHCQGCEDGGENYCHGIVDRNFHELREKFNRSQGLLSKRTELLRRVAGFLHQPGIAAGAHYRAEQHINHERFCDSCALYDEIMENLDGKRRRAR